MRVSPPLLEAYLNRRLVLVTGPRIARRASNTEIAPRVLEALRLRVPEEPEFFARMAQKLAEGRVPAVFGELRRRHSVVFEREVRAAFEAGDPAPPLPRAIAALAPMLQLVVTTELGRSLDIAFGGRWEEYARPPLDRQRHYLFKLHGLGHDASTWVLSSDDYERVGQADAERRRFLEGLLRSSTLLFLDFDMKDREMNDLRGALRAHPGAGRPHHFAYFSDDACDRFEGQELAREGIEVLSPPEGGGEEGVLALLGDLALAQAESPGAGPRRAEVEEILAFTRGGAAPSWRGGLLVFTANSGGENQVLDIEDELRGIRERVRGTWLTLDISPAASMSAVIRDLFEGRPTIVHFSAHGSESGELLLREGRGARKVTPDEIGRLLATVPVRPRLVTFCACYSDELARAAAQVASYAIGFGDRLPDAQAAVFSEVLYERLGQGAELSAAFEAAQLASAAPHAQLHSHPGFRR